MLKTKNLVHEIVKCGQGHDDILSWWSSEGATEKQLQSNDLSISFLTKTQNQEEKDSGPHLTSISKRTVFVLIKTAKANDCSVYSYRRTTRSFWF